MKIRYTLVSDGPTDATLIPIVDWTLKQTGAVDLAEGKRAEFWRLRQKPTGLKERLVKAVELFPCDILFVHRDAEKEQPAIRIGEIREAFDAAQEIQLPAVCVVPVRMLEAWLCFSERAIRQAAGNPNGTVLLDLPPLNQVETHAYPKETLKTALLCASELTGRRLKKFNVAAAFWRIVDFIDDFSPLRDLESFRAFEESVRSLHDSDWKRGFYG